MADSQTQNNPYKWLFLYFIMTLCINILSIGISYGTYYSYSIQNDENVNNLIVNYIENGGNWKTIYNLPDETGISISEKNMSNIDINSGSGDSGLSLQDLIDKIIPFNKWMKTVKGLFAILTPAVTFGIANDIDNIILKWIVTVFGLIQALIIVLVIIKLILNRFRA